MVLQADGAAVHHQKTSAPSGWTAVGGRQKAGDALKEFVAEGKEEEAGGGEEVIEQWCEYVRIAGM